MLKLFYFEITSKGNENETPSPTRILETNIITSLQIMAKSNWTPRITSTQCWFFLGHTSMGICRQTAGP